MKKLLRTVMCFFLSYLLLMSPMHIDEASHLNKLTGQLIASCAGSIDNKEAKDPVTEIAPTQADPSKKTVTATADGDIKYASLKAVNPLSNPTSLDDFTLISTPGTVKTSGGTLRYLKKVNACMMCRNYLMFVNIAQSSLIQYGMKLKDLKIRTLTMWIYQRIYGI